MELSATVLGGIEFHVDGRAVAVGGPRQRRLLGALLARRGDVISTQRLIDAVWDGAPPSSAERTFRTYIARLRRAFDEVGADGASLVKTASLGYSMSTEVELDADRFEAELARARRQLELGDAPAARRHVDSALESWSGDAFGEFAQEEWAVAEAVRLEELHLAARELSVEVDLELGSHEAAIAAVRRLVEEHPLRERPSLLLMLACYRSGRQVEALRFARRYGDHLRDQTGLDPSREFDLVQTRMLQQDPSLEDTIVNRTVRGYELDGVLATSARGVTHRAVRGPNNDEFALMAVAEQIADDPTFIRDFELVARTRAGIRHSSLMPWVDFWREPGAAFIVTQLPSDGSLRDRLASGGLAQLYDLREVVGEVGNALITLHRNDFAYGELSSDEVWFDHGRPVLLGPAVGVHGRTRRADTAEFGKLVSDIWAHTESAHVEIDEHRREPLERLLAAAAGSDFDSGIESLVDEVLRLLGNRRGGHSTSVHVANPYRGLEPFDERHAAVFFGRTVAIDRLEAETREQPFVAVVGASGSGKSSIVRAGLIPRVKTAGWFTTVMQPGTRPIDELASALRAVATEEVDLAGSLADISSTVSGVIADRHARLLLVVDQFEELWTVADEEQRDTMLAALAALAAQDARVHVVVTLRADYLGHALEHPAIGPLVRDHTTLLAPMTSDELFEAILEPARAVDVVVETELAAAIVADAGRSAGSLPLVQFALTELFERRIDDRVTLQAYRELGGLGGVIARRADEIFENLTPAEQRVAEITLPRLVSLDSAGDPTRRRVPSAELASASASASGVVAAFGEARLLTFDRDRSTREQVVEIAHESLAREWPRLRDWIDANHESIILLRHLTSAAASWLANDRDHAELYRGTRLEAIEDWARAHPEGLSGDEVEFLRESRAASDRARLDALRRSKRLRALTVGLALALTAVAAAGVTAAVQRGNALDSAEEADRNSVESTAQRLSVQAVDAIGEDPDLAILLALEAHRRPVDAGLEPVAGTIETLHTVTQSSRLLARFPGKTVSALSPTGNRAAIAGPNEVVTVDPETGDELSRKSLDDPVTGLAFSPQGDHVVVATERELALLGGADLSMLAARPVNCCILEPRFNARGDLIAGNSDGKSGARVQVWETTDLSAVGTTHEGVLAGWAGNDLIVQAQSSLHRIAPNGAVQDVHVPLDRIVVSDVHPDGEQLLVANEDDVVMLPIDEPAAAQSIDIDGWGVLFQDLRFSPTGDAAFAFGPSDEVRVVPLGDDRAHSFRGHLSVASASGDAAGHRVLVSGWDETLLWDRTEAGPADLGAVTVGGEVWDVSFSIDDDVVYVNEQIGDLARVRAIDLGEGSTVAQADFGAGAGFVYPVTTPAGLVAGWAPGGQSRVEDLTTGDVIARLSPCDVPRSIDAAGRWLLVSRGLLMVDFIADPGCQPGTSRVLDPQTGDVLLELPDDVVLSDIGPPGTISDGLIAYQSNPGSDEPAPLVIRDLRSGELVGRLTTFSPWRPLFSNDGRYIASGSAEDGGIAIDVEQVLAGASADDAIVANPRLEGATTFPVVVGDYLVTGHAGEMLRFWRLTDGQQELALPVNSGDSTFLAPTPDDRYLYYEDEGHLLRRFPLDVAELVELATRRVQRGFRADECERYELADDCESFVASQ